MMRHRAFPLVQMQIALGFGEGAICPWPCQVFYLFIYLFIYFYVWGRQSGCFYPLPKTKKEIKL